MRQWEWYTYRLGVIEEVSKPTRASLETGLEIALKDESGAHRDEDPGPGYEMSSVFWGMCSYSASGHTPGLESVPPPTLYGLTGPTLDLYVRCACEVLH